jgi:molecular chaperone GrpE
MSEKEIKKENQEKEKAAEDVTFENQEETKEGSVKEEEKGKKSPAKKSSKKTKKTSSQKKTEALQKQLDELNDKYLRLYSEFDNYRKRNAKERIELLKSASQEVILDVLPVVDDLERAIQSFEEHNLSKEAKKGVELIYNKLMNVLKQKGLEPIDAKGKDFDTDFHEAITNIPAPSDDLKGKVVDVIQKGYLLNGKIIRFAKVVVGQ